jgi:hypothetical protein
VNFSESFPNFAAFGQPTDRDAMDGHTLPSIEISDAHLLFAGDFRREGIDLIISDEFNRVTVPSYFKDPVPRPLVSPEGAQLDPAVVRALTGYTAYAQAGAPVGAGKVVGHIVKMTGSASVVRNGVTVVANTGDAIYQNDVVQTGSDSSLGLVLDDGSTFNLSANARFMLNDLSYDPSSVSNSALLTLVQGAASFVAGQVARTGDMKVATPAATIGIRGTAVNLDISSADGTVSVSVVDQRDGQVHTVQVFNNANVLIGTVTSDGPSLTLTPTATFDVIAAFSDKTADQVAREFNVFQQVLSTYDAAKQIFPNLPQHTENTHPDNNTSPNATTRFAGSPPLTPPGTEYHPTIGSTTPQTTGDPPLTKVVIGPIPAVGDPVPTTPASLDQVFVKPTSIPFVVTQPSVASITSGSGDHTGPVMSATGDVVYDPDGTIYFYDHLAHTTSTIASPSGGWSFGSPTISSDGRYIVYQGSNGGSPYVFVYGTDPSDPSHYHVQTQLAQGAAPCVSGDGSAIAVEQGGNIAIYGLQGDLKGTITPATVGSPGALWKPAISADGHVIAFWNSDASSPGGAGHLNVYDRSTGTLATIANTDLGAGNTAATLSADGHLVVYQATDVAGHSEIYLYDITAHAIVFHTFAVGSSYNPVLSPDGHFIVFTSDAKLTPDDQNGIADTYVVDVSNPAAPAYKLVSGENGASLSGGVAVSAGGQYLAVASNNNIFFVDPTSGHSAVILETANSPSNLSANGRIVLTGDYDPSQVSVSVVDQFGHPAQNFSAALTNGAIVWTFNEPKAHFDVLSYGQDATQQFIITLSVPTGSVTIPVFITVHDGVQPVVNVADFAPIAHAVTLPQGQQNAPYTLSSGALLTGVLDVDGPSLSITSVWIESGGGSLSKIDSQIWSYTPDPGFSGKVVFGYTVSDSIKIASSTATLNIALPLAITTIAPDSGVSGDFVTNATSLTVFGTNGSLSAGERIQVSSDDGSSWSDVVQDTAATWSYADPQTHSAQFTYRVRVIDSNNAVVNETHQAITVDDTAPAAPAAPHDSAVSGGYVNAANDSASQALTGTAEAGSTVKIYLNGSSSPAFTTTADGGGNWSQTIGHLADGSYSYTVTATDAAGNTSAPSSALAFVVDTAAPAAPATPHDSAVSGGYVNAANDSAGQALTGTAEAGSTVRIYLNGSSSPAFTTTADGGGNWSQTIGHLADGSYSYTVTATDAAGNTSAPSSALAFVVDTAAPAAPAAPHDSAVSGGYVNAANDGAGQALTGTAEAGSTVKIYLNGSSSPSFTTTADGSGNWSQTVGHLADGSYSYTVTATDAAGNTSAPSSALAFVVDTAAPAAPAAPHDSAVSGGYVNAANDGASQALTGTAEAGSTVRIYLNGSGSPAFTTTADGSGNWSQTIGHLADGSYSYTVTATDAAGNTSAPSSALAFVVDTAAPAAPAAPHDSAVSGGYVNAANDGASQALTGTAEAGSTVRIYLNGSSSPAFTTTADGSGNWSQTIGHLADGSYSYTVTATDAAGNTSAPSSPLAFVVDTAAPLVSITSTGGLTNQAGQTITGTVDVADAGATVTVLDGNTPVGSALVQNDGSWSSNVTLSQGSNTLIARVSDAAGNTGTSNSVVYTLNSTAPVVTSITTSGSGISNGSGDLGAGNVVSLTVVFSAAVTVAGTPTLALDDGGTASYQSGSGSTTLVFSYTVAAGQNSPDLTVSSLNLNGGSIKDAAGNAADLSGATTYNPAGVLQIDTSAPAAPAAPHDSAVSGGYVNAANDGAGQALTGTAEAGSTVKIYLNGSGSPAFTTTADGSGNWSQTVGHLADGSYSYTVTATDAAGNTSAPSSPLAFVVDTAAPLVSITSTGGLTNQAGQTITGTVDVADAGATVTVLDGNTPVGSAIVQNDGSWSSNVTLSQGSNTLIARVSDAAGNTGTSNSVVYTLNSTAPVVTSITTSGSGISNGSGDLGAGNVVSLTVVFSAAVTVAGIPVLALDDGGTASYQSGSGSTTLVFSTTVAAGQNSPDLTVSSLNLNGGSIKDAAGNAADLSGATNYNPAGVLQIDTSAPAAPAAPHDSAVSGGYVNAANDGASQALTGTAEAGSTVRIYLNGLSSPAFTTTADGSGNWSQTVGHLADGSYSYTVTATDAAGNTSAPSSALAFVVDTSAPAAPAAPHDSAVSGGYVNAANDSASQALTGTAEAGSTVKIYLNGSNSPAFTTTADGSGNWSQTVGHLADGSYSYTVTATDAAGNTSAPSSALAFVVDTSAPAAPAAPHDSAVSGGYVNAANDGAGQALTGTAEAGSTVKIYLNGSSSPAFTTTADGSGNWSQTIGHLADGSYSYTVTATDAAGNTSAPSSALAFVVDTAAPAAPATPHDSAVSGGYVNAANDGASQALTGTAEAGSTVKIYLNGSGSPAFTTTADGSGNWSQTIGHLADGSYSYTVTATDAAGNTSAPSSALAFVVDTSIPSGPAPSLARGSDTGSSNADNTTSAKNPIIRVVLDSNVAAGDTIQLLLAGVPLAHAVTHIVTAADVTAGIIYLPITVGDLGADGAKQVSAKFTDAAGNSSTSSALNFTLDSIAPVQPLSFSGLTRTSGSPALNVSGVNGALAPGETIQISTDQGSSWVAVTQNTSTTWSFVDSNPAQYPFSYVVRIVDTAGNVGSKISQSISKESLTPVVNEVLDPANSANINLAPTGNISGSEDGVEAFTVGQGNIVINSSGANISAARRYGIEATSNSAGNISVTTSATDQISSGSVGINAYNQASILPQLGGVTASSITVSAHGSINSGAILTGSGARPAGILAGYRGGTSNTPNPQVFGNVTIDNSANIVAAAGDGIRGYNYGNGDISITDRAGTTISAPEVYGITASSYGSGKVTVTTEANSVINSGASGIVAINQATAIAPGSGSSISVVANGTINSGTNVNAGSGSLPQGISAGYFPGNVGVSNTGVNGSVSVDNFGNITATAGWGINAYNWGNGDVAIKDEANTHVFGGQTGLAASALSSGSTASGAVSIQVGQNATISTSSFAGLVGVIASVNHDGNISIATSSGDVINSSGTGIRANVATSSASATSLISVVAAGQINSGFNTSGGQPGGIWAGYSSSNGNVLPNVHGNINIDSSAIINALSGVGIGSYDVGTGNTTVTLASSSSITADTAGLSIFGQGGGSITITNSGSIVAPHGAGILAGTGTGLTSTGQGVLTITNSGAVGALGSEIFPVVQLNNFSSKDAVLTNSGTLTSYAYLNGGSLSRAIGDYNGPINTNTGALTVVNTGSILGNVSFGGPLSATTFRNEAGASWFVRGSSYFGGSSSNSVINAGTIHLAGRSNLYTAANFSIANSGQIDIDVNSVVALFGNITGGGKISIGDRSQLELGGSVDPNQALEFSSARGELTLDNPASFNLGSIFGVQAGDLVNLYGGFTVTSASLSGSTLSLSNSFQNTSLTYNLAGSPAVAVDILDGSTIVFVPTGFTSVSAVSGAYSDSLSTSKAYVFSSDPINSSGAGIAITSTDNNPNDTIMVIVNSTSSISSVNAGLNVTSTGANLSIVNAASITSSNGAGISTNSQTGSTDIIDYADISARNQAITSRVTGSGSLNISVLTSAKLNSTNSNGIQAISTLGPISIQTSQNTTINSGASGIFAQNQGSSVPSSSVTVLSAATINATASGISASFILGPTIPSAPPDPPNTAVHGNVTVDNVGQITSAASVAINAYNYGVGDVTVSNNAAITANGPAPTQAQYGIFGFNYGSGKVAVSTGFNSNIVSGSTGINAGNQATAILQSDQSTISVVAEGSIHSGANNNNSGSAPAGILAGYNPGGNAVYQPNLVHGDVFVTDSASIVADAGSGINGYNYGDGDITISLGANVSIQALTAATSSSGKAPYGVKATNYGPGNITITTSNGDSIVAGSNGIDAASTASAATNAVIAVWTAPGTIQAKSVPTNLNNAPSGISAGFLGGPSGTAQNLNVNGTVNVNNAANITADSGIGINAYHYGNGDILVNVDSGAVVSGFLHGVEAHKEAADSTGDISINLYSGATVTATSTTNASYGLYGSSRGNGNISIVSSAGSTVNAGSSGISAVNIASSLPKTANSSIVVTAAGTINSGTHVTGTGNPPAGIVAGYLGPNGIPTTFPLDTVFGNVVVNNTATINAASGDGVRAYTFGIGDVTIHDVGGKIAAPGGQTPVNGYGIGLSAHNYGSGNITISTTDTTSITSGGSGISALNKAVSSPSFTVPSTSLISVVAFGSIQSGTIATGSGDVAAGILAGYNPNNLDTVDTGIHGNVVIDDYASVMAAAGTDGLRGINYGTGDVTISAEAGAFVSGGRYGIAGQSFGGGNVTIANHGLVSGTTAALDATAAGGSISVDNAGHLIGNVIETAGTFLNEVGAQWSLTGGISSFGPSSTVLNEGMVQSDGASLISGMSNFVNHGIVEVLSGILEISGPVAGGGAVMIYGATLQLDGPADSKVSFASSAHGSLVLKDAAHFTGTISGFAAGDVIDLSNISPSNVKIAGEPGSLSLDYGAGKITLLGNYDAASFAISSDGATGAQIVWQHEAPRIDTTQLAVAHVSGSTTISGLALLDDDPLAPTETFQLLTSDLKTAVGSGISPSSGAGSFGATNSVLSTGLTYNPGSTAPATDKVTLTISDDFGASDAVNFIFANGANSAGLHLQGTNGKDVIFATNGSDTLTGGGASDQFIFTPTTSSALVQHTITDFETIDRLDLRQFSNISGSSLPSAVQQGSDTLVVLDSHDTLLLKNFVATALATQNFIVHS